MIKQLYYLKIRKEQIINLVEFFTKISYTVSLKIYNQYSIFSRNNIFTDLI